MSQGDGDGSQWPAVEGVRRERVARRRDHAAPAGRTPPRHVRHAAGPYLAVGRRAALPDGVRDALRPEVRDITTPPNTGCLAICIPDVCGRLQRTLAT